MDGPTPQALMKLIANSEIETELLKTVRLVLSQYGINLDQTVIEQNFTPCGAEMLEVRSKETRVLFGHVFRPEEDAPYEFIRLPKFEEDAVDASA